MNLGTWGDSNGDSSDHPEGNITNGKDQMEADHWKDRIIDHQELCISLLNIQTFPNYVLHHKNGCIIQLMNDNKINFLGMTKMNTYLSVLSTQHQL